MKRRLRRAVFLALLALGSMGLLATGSGVWGGSPWPWLVVLALAVSAQVAGDHYDQRVRLARRVERRLTEMVERIRKAEATHIDDCHGLAQRIAEVRAHVEAVGTPEGMRALVENVNRIATDLKPIKEQMDSIRSAGGLRSMLERR
jgi:hypothetical protein